MNYRHIFHAGNISDVVKHAVLTLIMQTLRAKDKSFCVLDTHAGIGLYDLQEERALKTNEAESGIYRLLVSQPIAGLQDYYRIIHELNPGAPVAKPRYYPGSPLLVRQMLRQQDRLIACELHVEDFAQLKRQFRNDRHVQIHHRDGYEALGAFLPPEEKRGLVLIDPPYESIDEFSRLARAIIEAHKRWPQGIFMLWYPVKDRPALWQFHETLAASGIPKQLCAEFIYEEEVRTDRLNGCGFVFINPPWRLDEQLTHLFPALHQAMQTNHDGSIVKWLVAG